MGSESLPLDKNTVDLRQFKEKLAKKLPHDNPVLVDLLSEPDNMTIARAEVLIPHYLQRLERELEKDEVRGPIVLRR
jgi:hypothetical protein